jgi:hypothetical protein
MCVRIWVRPNGPEINNQYDLAKWLGVKVHRLPIGQHYDATALRGALCLCPVDIERALTDASVNFERGDTGDYIVRNS